MKYTMPIRMLVALLSMLAAVYVCAQETESAAAPAPPDFASLDSAWWSYFQGSREEIEPRVASFLDNTRAQIADLNAQDQEVAGRILDAVRDNFNALLTLRDDVEAQPQELPEEAPGYSIEDLLNFAAVARQARATAAEELVAVTREQRVLDGATRRRDAAFKTYVESRAGDERWLAALRLVQARSAQAISTRRLELLTDRLERGAAFAEQATARVELVTDRLTATVEESHVQELRRQVEANRSAVTAAEDRVRDAQLAASGLDVNTAEGRSQQRLERQRLVDAELDLALAEVTLAQSEAHLRWSRIVQEADSDAGATADQQLAWSELIRSIEQRAPDWERETGDELLAAQGADRNDLDRAAIRLLDQRVGTAQQTLAQFGRLRAAIDDLRLLMAAVDKTAAAYEGAFKSLLSGVSRVAKSAFLRVAGLGDVTLFSIGEAPVTGGDILRGILIMVVAMLLSRGIRAAIGRVGEGEPGGTQASLYTVGRLTHYTIIILALFIALSSIGLDFGSLALVAGALSVGIGFGLQSIVNNFVSGLIILFEHSLRVGDYIELDNGLTGTVKAINVRSTLINTNDNIDIVVPNSEFVTTRLTNWTLNEGTRRVRIPFGVAYGSDKEVVRKAALEAAAEVPYTLANRKGREADVWLVEYGDSSLNFLLLVWVNRQGARRPTRCRSAYLWALETKLSEYAIEIPFPQRDLHLKSGWPQRA